MTNIFERALTIADQCMKCVYGELFEPVAEDKPELVKQMKTAMLKRTAVIDLTVVASSLIS